MWRIISVANINPIKGLEKFLELAVILNKKIDHPLEFRIVGFVYESQRNFFDGLQNLKKILNLYNLVFVGGLKDVRKELANADVYVCTSLSEASPTSVWEALAMGLPTVTTDVGEVDYIIENAKSGFVCKRNSAQELANRIEEILVSEELTDMMGTQARNRAVKLLDVRSVSKQHYKVYQTVMKEVK